MNVIKCITENTYLNALSETYVVRFLSHGISAIARTSRNLAGRAVSWVLSCFGTTEKINQTALKSFNHAAPVPAPLNELMQPAAPALNGKEPDFAELLDQTQKAALQSHPLAANLPTSETLCNMLSEIVSKFKGMNREELLHKYYTPYASDVEELRSFCVRQFPYEDVWCTGRNGINLRYLTEEDIVKKLSKPGLLEAILALQACSDFANINVNEAYKLSLYSMLFYGLQANSTMSLGLLPTNSNLLQSLQDKELFRNACLKEYLRKKDPENYTLHLLYKIVEVHQAEVSAAKPVTDTPTVYSLSSWKKYQEELLKPIIDKIKQTSNRAVLLGNAGGFSSGWMRGEARGLLRTFCDCAGLEYETNDDGVSLITYSYKKIRFHDFVKRFAESYEVLYPRVSHLFDRLHLLASLMDEEPAMHFQDGKYSMRQFHLAVIQTFIDNPSQQNAIAAEQMYLRLNAILQSFETI